MTAIRSWIRITLAGVALVSLASVALGQATGGSSLPPRWGAVRSSQSGSGFNAMPSTGGLSTIEGFGNAVGQWLNSGQPGSGLVPVAPNGPATQPGTSLQPRPAGDPAARGLRVTKGSGVLPNDRGQVWREYDITPYTSRVTDRQKPEQEILDWVLRETGPDLWFTQPLGILNVDNRTLRVYHTPEVQELVKNVVQRFVDSDAQEHAIGLKLMMIGGPSWRARVLPLLTPVDIQSPGVEAWLVTKENAALLLKELNGRADVRELQVPNFYVTNASSQSFGRTRERTYNRSVRLRNDVWPGYELVSGKLQEGFHLEVSPLVSADGRVCDVALKCNIDEVEKLVNVAVDVPAASGPQRVELQIPQVVSWRLVERFRWPADQVLLLSCGVVVNPDPAAGASGIGIPFLQTTNRADALLMVEDWGRPAAEVVGPQPSVSNLPGVRRY
jgi:hypothetical protein